MTSQQVGRVPQHTSESICTSSYDLEGLTDLASSLPTTSATFTPLPTQGPPFSLSNQSRTCLPSALACAVPPSQKGPSSEPWMASPFIPSHPAGLSTHAPTQKDLPGSPHLNSTVTPYFLPDFLFQYFTINSHSSNNLVNFFSTHCRASSSYFSVGFVLFL